MPSVDLRLLRLAIGDHRREQAATHIEPFSASSLDYTSVPADFDSELGITKLRDGILFDLDFETTVVGPCQRCLGEARLELAIDGREYQADAPTPDGDAETTPYLTGEVLDLDDWARDAVILALPLVITCASSVSAGGERGRRSGVGGSRAGAHRSVGFGKCLYRRPPI